jgi:hypothetical protein
MIAAARVLGWSFDAFQTLITLDCRFAVDASWVEIGTLAGALIVLPFLFTDTDHATHSMDQTLHNSFGVPYTISLLDNLVTNLAISTIGVFKGQTKARGLVLAFQIAFVDRR